MKNQVLIVDDDAAIRDSLQQILADAGYAVVSAADGKEAIALLQKSTPDLLLLDLDLPILSGFDVLELTRTQFPSLAVIVVTGMSGECEPGALFGADALLEKPPDVERLLSLMQTLLAEPEEARLRRLCDGPTCAPSLPYGSPGLGTAMPEPIPGTMLPKSSDTTV